MPSYDTATYLPEAVASVQRQTVRDWELLIVDDASTDGSLAIAKGLDESDSRVRCLEQARNLGPACARAAGIAQARGQFIAFLDSDDRWKPQKLERQLAFMELVGSPFSFTAYELVNRRGAPVGVRVPAPKRQTHKQLLFANRIGCLTAICRREVLLQTPLPTWRKRGDYALWLQLLRKVPEAHGLNESLAEYRLRPGSVSSDKLSLVRYNWRICREQEGLSFGRSVLSLAGGAAYSLGKNVKAFFGQGRRYFRR